MGKKNKRYSVLNVQTGRVKHSRQTRAAGTMEFMARLSSLAAAVGADVNEVPQPTRARSRGLGSRRHRACAPQPARKSACPARSSARTSLGLHFSARSHSFPPPRSCPRPCLAADPVGVSHGSRRVWLQQMLRGTSQQAPGGEGGRMEVWSACMHACIECGSDKRCAAVGAGHGERRR